MEEEADIRSILRQQVGHATPDAASTVAVRFDLGTRTFLERMTTNLTIRATYALGLDGTASC